MPMSALLCPLHSEPSAVAAAAADVVAVVAAAVFAIVALVVSIWHIRGPR